MKDEKKLKYGLFSSILLGLGAILGLVVSISDGESKNMVLYGICTILLLALIFYNLKLYLDVYKSKSNGFLSALSHIVSFIFYVIMLLGGIMVLIVLSIGVSFIQERLLIKGEYIFFVIKHPYSYLIYALITIIGTKMGAVLFKKENIFSIKSRFDKVLLVATILSIYIVLTSITVLKEDGIYDYRFYNVKGNKYSFSDVEYVNTGFKESGKNKGSFYYDIKMKNGVTLKLSHPSLSTLSDKYKVDTWQEYVDIDKYIMAGGAKKESSENGSEHAQLGEIYLDKLLTVISNK